MKPWVLILPVLIGAHSSHATTFQTVVGGKDADRGVFVSPTADGGYITVGATRSYGAGGEDVYLVKTDSEGQVSWWKTYGGEWEDNGWAVSELRDGYVISGFTKSFGAGGFDFYLVRTDGDGELLWSKTYGGEADDRCWALAVTEDGGFVLAGETKSFGAGQEDFHVVKVDSTGTELWSRSYGGEKGDRCFSLVQTGDGGYLLVGQTYSEGAGDRDAYVMKIDVAGERQWSKTFGGSASDVGHCVAPMADGSFLVTGYTTSLAAEDDDPYIIKIDALGKVHWARVLTMEGVNHTITGEQATDGGYFLVGFSEFPSRGSNAVLVVKTTPDGKLEWHEDLLLTNMGRSMGYTLRATMDGGCVFTGHTTVGSAGSVDLLMVKMAPRASTEENRP